MTLVAQDRINHISVEERYKGEMKEHNNNQGQKKRKRMVEEQQHIEMLTSKDVMQMVTEGSNL